MRVLRRHPPTPEQINIVRRIQQGVSLIRGSAGSGKTSTALTALRATTGTTVNQLRNEGALPANVLVLTYYNSLRGYITAVAEVELADYADDAQLVIMTFDKWAFATLGWRGHLDIVACENQLLALCFPFPRDTNFAIDEAQYVLGRFRPNALDEYLVRPRTGRGNAPSMDRPMRQRFLDEVVRPYLEWKRARGARDFHDLSFAMADAVPSVTYDVIVIDEAQDLSANQIRAVMAHAAPGATITIVTDTAQRIYPRGSPWAEAGVLLHPNRSFRLTRNYRNTRQTASLAAALASGLVLDEDGSLPDPALCTRDGRLPVFLLGRFREQLRWVVDWLSTVDLERETVGFLHLKGGGWFDDIREGLSDGGFEYCELQGVNEWPEHGPNIGLCTFHSAKGLEFDHVVMIGLAQENASHGAEIEDDRYAALRRLLAMGVGRARETVILGAKPGAELSALHFIAADTVEVIRL